MTEPMPLTREEASDAAGRALAAGYEILRRAPLEEAVEAAFTPTGPPREVLRERIITWRTKRGLPIRAALASVS